MQTVPGNTPVSFLGRNKWAPIGRDIAGPFDQSRCEQAEPSRRAADPEGA
jgi:hypothetical protein